MSARLFNVPASLNLSIRPCMLKLLNSHLNVAFIWILLAAVVMFPKGGFVIWTGSQQCCGHSCFLINASDLKRAFILLMRKQIHIQPWSNHCSTFKHGQQTSYWYRALTLTKHLKTLHSHLIYLFHHSFSWESITTNRQWGNLSLLSQLQNIEDPISDWWLVTVQ